MDGIEHRYYLDGSQITAEMWTLNGVEYLLYYLYDETGSPLGMQYRTSDYTAGTFKFFFFEKNLQGDIIGIYNSNGIKICTYNYDAWGNCSVSTKSGVSALELYVAYTYNPFRYRGYYYDLGTGWYYLQSRYYNPNWGRFLNADCYISTGTGMLGYNMFAYCNNNPVMFVDPNGESILGVILLVIGGAALIMGLTGCTSTSPVDADQEELDRKMLDPGSYDTPEEALDAGLNYAKESSAKVDMEYGGYVFERNGRYYYKAGAEILYSHSQKNVFEINLRANETLISVFHTHPFHKTDTVFSLADFQHAKAHGVDSYIIDNEGHIYCLPIGARDQTEYFQIR